MTDPRVAAFPSGFYDNVDLELLLDGIFVSPFADKWVVDAVQAYLARVGLADRLRESRLRSEPLYDAVPITRQMQAILAQLGSPPQSS